MHRITQGEGGEQGDPLMPALFALGLHDALAAARKEMAAEDLLVAYLDDVYMVTARDRAKESYKLVTKKIEDLSGIQPNLGKTKAWSAAGGEAPQGGFES